MRFLTISLFFIVFSGLSAQRQDSTYHLGFTATGTYNQTNQVNTFLLNNQLRTGIKRKNLVTHANCRWLYGKQSTRRTNNDFSAVVDVNAFRFMKHAYVWGLFIYNNIYSLRVNQQVQTGAGLAYNVIDKKSFQLNFSDGLLYDFSDVQVADSIRDVYQTLRNSFRLQLRIVRQNLTFRTAGFIQNSLEHKKDVIIKADLTLAYRFKKHLSVTVQSNYNRMTRTNKETLFLTYGLQFERFF